MSTGERHIILGTAGHIDHGKSTLVRALTGTDPDRLREEKERGMTIDLGYAFYSENVAIIDVPGHERFIKNMVAGVTTVDAVLLVVAADDGVMPQTREHLDILDLLGLKKGIVVINKIDLVDGEWLELVVEDVRELIQGTFLEKAPIVRVSAATGDGIPELRAAIDRLCQELPPRDDRGFFWMPVDRSFIVQGFGTVVTGSVLSGRVKTGDDLELLPQKKTVKVRGIQRHGKQAEAARVGDRAALNLQGVHKEDVERGNVLCEPGMGLVTRRLDVWLRLLESSPWVLKDQDRVRFHVGTSEIFARVRLLNAGELAPGESGFAQLLLESAIPARRFDRFVIRKYSPPVTMGGGVVLDQLPLQRHKKRDATVLQHLEKLSGGDPDVAVLEFLRWSRKGRMLREISAAVSLSEDRCREILDQLQKNGDVNTYGSASLKKFVAAAIVESLEQAILQTLEEYHRKHPHLPGMTLAQLASQVARTPDTAMVEFLLKKLEDRKLVQRKGEYYNRAGFTAELPPGLRKLYPEMMETLRQRGMLAPTVKELKEELGLETGQLNDLLAYGKNQGDLVVLPNGLVYRTDILRQIEAIIRDEIQSRGSITVAHFRDRVGASRKFAVALLEYFDQVGLTVRQGDERVLKEGAFSGNPG